MHLLGTVSLFFCRKRTVQLEDFHCIAMLGRGHFGKVVGKYTVEEGSGCDSGALPGGLNRNTAVQERFVAVQIWNKPSPATQAADNCC